MTNNENKNYPIIEITQELVEQKTYLIRGQKVMLDFDLAEIYGYETKTFNQQVKNNIDKFPSNFMFKLNSIEFSELTWSKNLTTFKEKFRRKRAKKLNIDNSAKNKKKYRVKKRVKN